MYKIECYGNDRFSEVAKLTGLSKSTLVNWKKKKTKRPQAATLSAAGGLKGKQLAWVDKKRPTR